MTQLRYDPSEIEPRWQAIWAEEHTWEVANDNASGRPRSYVLEMLPYPSGEPHIGHLKVYSVGDAIAHFRRRRGAEVLHPMGYDAFGLPAENNAIATGVHPRDSTNASIASFQRQFRDWGISIDWSRELATARPALLPLDAVDLPRALQGRPRLPQARPRSTGAPTTRPCSPTSR
jgi:leucyl-tRNA synthetase